MSPFDPILHDHEKRLKMLEASRRDLEDQMVVMAAMERRQEARIETWEEFMYEQIQAEIEQKAKREQAQREHEEWKTHHELAMKEFDDKLNGLIAWLDDFVKRNPKNGK
jgi:glucan phosphorylase